MNQEQIVEILTERAEYWRDLYNRMPVNDRDENTSDYAKGSFMALYEVIKYLTHEQYQ